MGNRSSSCASRPKPSPEVSRLCSGREGALLSGIACPVGYTGYALEDALPAGAGVRGGNDLAEAVGGLNGEGRSVGHSVSEVEIDREGAGGLAVGLPCPGLVWDLKWQEPFRCLESLGDGAEGDCLVSSDGRSRDQFFSSRCNCGGATRMGGCCKFEQGQQELGWGRNAAEMWRRWR